MSFFRLRTVPGCSWPPLPDAVFAQAWNAYLELERTQWLDRAELEQHQLTQVRTLLSHCIAHVPYYRDTFTKAGVVPDDVKTMHDFRRLPFLPRRTCQEQRFAIIATALPPGTVADATSQTSGSTGSPTDVHATNMTQLWWHACYLRDLQWCGMDPTGTLAAIRYSGKTGAELERLLQGASLSCWSTPLEPLIQTGPAHGMDIRQDPRVQLQWLRRIAPDYVLSLPANLEALAHLARSEGPIPSLRAIQSIASTLTPEVQADIESAFGVPVRNTYSCYEAGYLASPCPEGHGLHVHAENVILEVLDDNDVPCQPGQTGKVFVTHLHNLRGPFVRYELGDLATLGPAQCPCGRGLPTLARVEGKTFPLFRLAGGKRKHCSGIINVLREVGGNWQHQVVQKAEDHVVVRVSRDPSWTDAHAEQIRAAMHRFFETPIRVDFEYLDCLPLPPSGKFQVIVIEMPGP